MLWLSVRVDTGFLEANAGWWAEALGYSPQFATALFAVAAATALLLLSPSATHNATADPQSSSARLPRSAARTATAWPYLLGHVAAFGLFAILLINLVEGRLSVSPHAGAWLALCVVCGAATVLLLPLAVYPPRALLEFGRARRPVLLGGLLVGTAAWSAGFLTTSLWPLLHRPSFVVVERLLTLAGQQVLSRPERMELGVVGRNGIFAVNISPECSGYQGIGLVAVFLAVYLWMARRELRLPQAMLLIPLGVSLIWLANEVRLAALLMLGAWVSPGMALGGFHSQAGWLSFILVSLGIVAASQRVRFFRSVSSTGGDNPTAAYLAAFLTIALVSMVSSAITPEFDTLYPLRVLAVLAVLWFFWRKRLSLAALKGSWSVISVVIGVVVFVLWIGLERTALGGASTTMGATLARMPEGWAGLWLFFRMLGSVVTGPIAEELAFRGFLMRRLVASDFERVRPGTLTWTSFLVSSLVFGVLHGRWLAGTVAGMAYALAYWWRGRLSDAIIAHAITNALIGVFVLATGSWQLW